MSIRIIAVSLFVIACSTDPLPAGAKCTQSADCAAMLSCLDFAQFMGTTCTVIGKSCSKTCSVDADCASLGPRFKCFATCGTDKACGATGP